VPPSTSGLQRTGDVFAVEIDDVDSVSGDVSVALVGELDLCTMSTLTVALSALAGARPELAGAPPGGTVRLDLSRLSFMDVAGLRGLTENSAALVARGWRVSPPHPQRQIGWMLDFAGQQGWLPTDFTCDGEVPSVPVQPAAATRPNVQRLRMHSLVALEISGVNARATDRFFGSGRIDDCLVTVTVLGAVEGQSLDRAP